MLILTRKINQKLIINDDIEVIILESCKNSVKIGINAPSHVQVYREEIYNEIKKSNTQANKADINTINFLISKNNQQGRTFDFVKKMHKND